MVIVHRGRIAIGTPGRRLARPLREPVRPSAVAAARGRLEVVGRRGRVDAVAGGIGPRSLEVRRRGAGHYDRRADAAAVSAGMQHGSDDVGGFGDELVEARTPPRVGVPAALHRVVPAQTQQCLVQVTAKELHLYSTTSGNCSCSGAVHFISFHLFIFSWYNIYIKAEQ